MNVALWSQEFGTEYAIPAEITALVEAGKLFDASWHNDVCPSFANHPHCEGRRLWVGHPNPDEREVPGGSRYCVSSDDGEDFTEFYLGDDLNAALAAILPNNIYALLAINFGTENLEPRHEELSTWELTTECGQACVKIVDAAIALRKLCDPVAHDSIERAVIDAIDVVCFG